MKKHILYIFIFIIQTISYNHAQDFVSTDFDEELENHFIGNSEDTPYIAKDPANTTQREEEDMFYNEGEDQDD